MASTNKADKNGLLRIVVWVAFLLAIVGGIASRNTDYGRWVGRQVTHGNHLLVPLGVFVLLTGFLVWSLVDKSPDLVSFFTIMTIPSVPAPYTDGLIGWAVNWPFNFVYGLLADNAKFLFGKGGDPSEFAGLCWFVVITVGAIALVKWVRGRMKGGGKKSNDEFADLFGGKK
jgi:hypothetical protein